jgi:hypothetical protein
MLQGPLRKMGSTAAPTYRAEAGQIHSTEMMSDARWKTQPTPKDWRKRLWSARLSLESAPGSEKP